MTAQPSSKNSRRFKKSHWFIIIVLGAVVAAVTFTIVKVNEMINPEPPETTYTQAEAYAPMESAVSELVEALPDFPGFERRSWATIECTHNGRTNTEYTNIEIRYLFSNDISATELVQEDYLEFLRQYWADLGYDIHRDEPVGGQGQFHSIEARRDDGINFYYSVGSTVGLMIQSGCVPRSDKSEIEYIPPSGGIVPGSEEDTVAHDRRYFPDGIPTEEESTDAIAPFEGTGNSVIAFDSPASYNCQL